MFRFQAIIASLIIGFLTAMSRAVDPAEFFNISDGNLTRITWAHAVNNQSYLEEALKNKDIMMLEADIVIGKLNGTGEDLPIMGHPPENSSDLSLKDFLLQTNGSLRKGIKLDFKSLDALKAAESDLQQYETASYPIFLNADIIPGPINAPQPVNATEFLNVAKTFDNFTLSLGWSTKDGNTTGSYHDNQIKNMIDAIEQNQITQNITFAVRAGFAAESVEQMNTLIEKIPKSTLTLWGSAGDYVNVTNLSKLIDKIGVDKVYIDVPDDILNNGAVITKPVYMALAMILGLFVRMTTLH